MLAWLAVSLSFFALLKTGALGPTGTMVLDDYVSALAPLLGGVACLRRARRDVVARRAWLLLGTSLLTWTAGGVAWAVYEVHLGREVPFPSIADVGYLLAVPFAIAALLSFPGTRSTGTARLRPLLDGGIAAGALLFISWATVLGPVFHEGSGSVLAQVIAPAYPACDVLTATLALLTLARARGERRVTMAMIAGGMAIVALADSSFTWFTAHGSYVTGNLFDIGYVAGYLLIGVAALRPVSAEPEADIKLLGPARWSQALPYLPLLVGIPLAVVLQVRDAQVGPFLFYDGLFVVAAVLGRQLVSLQANVVLTRQLGATVAELRDREVQLHHQAFHDRLTGLANRALLADRLDHALARQRGPFPVFLLLADLDDFKAVNDTLGHPAGDVLLIAVAERLRAAVRPEDTVARLGGDEFAVLLEGTRSLTDAQAVAERIAQSLAHPFSLAGTPAVMSASIGVAVGEPTSTGAAMLRDADVAMYASKRQGQGCYTIYASELAAANIGRLQLKNDLTTALDQGQLSVVYQPIVELDTGYVTGVEALLRWNHPVRGDIPPEVFVPLAEDSGAILPIGRWVLATACAEAGRWQRLRAPHGGTVELHVNLSGKQLGDLLLLDAARTALRSAGLAADQLTLEITESVLLDDDDSTMAQLHAIRALGVRLAIDDFGTGYSALSRLRRYPINCLKIDKSFVDVLDTDGATPDVVVGAVIDLGRGLGMKVIAEGIESDAQLTALRALGCPAGQGFLFSRPAEPEAITELVRTGILLVDAVTRS